MEKIKVDEIVLVEGRYDKTKLASLVEGTILETGGFRIFKDKEKMAYIQMAAAKRGVVVLTDSDGAGFQIRNFLKRELRDCVVKHAYIPDILGKEARKEKPSGEGKLGVEGMEIEVLRRALERAGVCQGLRTSPILSKVRLYEDGLVGGDRSAERRRQLAESLGLPTRMSSNALVEAMNLMLTEEEYEAALAALEDI